ncbi:MULTISPECIES: DUF945 family protein [unclassified Thioalkalivibrio]|uniref:DUF945 family protein n=1 Tax=unclassified Thioalkalivibrio TaxID=2621013 RepID=UPI00039DF16D|nr:MULTISPECIES: DUF945 family protein [unclassified Thioalkalivibrio]
MASLRGLVGGSLALIILLVMGWAGSTWYLGATINERLEQEVERIAGLAYVESVAYEKTRGFLSTEFFLAVHFADQENSGFGNRSTEGFPPIGLSSTIQHGPVLGWSSGKTGSAAKAEIHEILFLGMIVPVSDSSVVTGVLDDRVSGNLVVDRHVETFSGEFPSTEAIENLSMWFEGDSEGWSLDVSIDSWRWLHDVSDVDWIDKEMAEGEMESIKASLDYEPLSAGRGPVFSLSVGIEEAFSIERGARRGDAPNQWELGESQIQVLGRGHGVNWDAVWDWDIVFSASSVISRDGDETFETGETTMEAGVSTDGGYSNVQLNWSYNDLDVPFLDLTDFQGRMDIRRIPPRDLIKFRDKVRDLRSDPLGFYEGPEGYGIATREAAEAAFGGPAGSGLPLSADVRGRTSDGEWGVRGETRLDVANLLSQPYPFLVLLWPEPNLRLVLDFDDELLNALWGRELKRGYLEEFGLSEQPDGYTIRLRAHNGRIFRGRRDVTEVYQAWVEWLFVDSGVEHE